MRRRRGAAPEPRSRLPLPLRPRHGRRPRGQPKHTSSSDPTSSQLVFGTVAKPSRRTEGWTFSTARCTSCIVTASPSSSPAESGPLPRRGEGGSWLSPSSIFWSGASKTLRGGDCDRSRGRTPRETTPGSAARPQLPSPAATAGPRAPEDALHRERRSFLHERHQVGADKAWRLLGDFVKVKAALETHAAGQDSKDARACGFRGDAHRNLAVKPPGAAQRRVDRIGAVRGTCASREAREARRSRSAGSRLGGQARDDEGADLARGDVPTCEATSRPERLVSDPAASQEAASAWSKRAARERLRA